MPTPRPEGWKGGSDDFTFVRTLDGHIAHDSDKEPQDESNARTYDNVWLGGTDYDTGGS